MDKLKLLVSLVLICAVVLFAMYMAKKTGKTKTPETTSAEPDSGLIDTIRVEKHYDYKEDPDEEGECGDALPLDDAEGLFDKDKTPKDRQTLIDIAQRQGFKVGKDR